MPRAASSGTSPSGRFQTIVPEFRSYAVSDVQGGEIGDRPELVVMKQKRVRYGPAKVRFEGVSLCPEANAGSELWSARKRNASNLSWSAADKCALPGIRPRP